MSLNPIGDAYERLTNISFDFLYKEKGEQHVKEFMVTFKSEKMKSITSGWHSGKKKAKEEVCLKLLEILDVSKEYDLVNRTNNLEAFYSWEDRITELMERFEIKDTSIDFYDPNTNITSSRSSFKIFKLAFMHKSYRKYLNLDDTRLLQVYLDDEFCDYERLECLGDTILGFTIVKTLYSVRELSPGKITRLKSFLVSNQRFANLTDELDTAKYCLTYNCKINNRLKADIYESLVGALSLIKGIAYTRKFILKNIDLKSIISN